MIDILIERAEVDDLPEILSLQHIAFISEAELFGTRDIEPLTATLDDLIQEYHNGVVFKMVYKNTIIGSIRVRIDATSVYIGKLMIHPDYQRQGLGTRLLLEMERFFPGRRYELFTSTRSVKNIRLYEKLGYRRFKECQVTDKLIFVYLEKNAKGDFKTAD